MMKSVAVITPATSNVQLLDAVESVATQTYPNVCHHIVCNGTKHWQGLMSHNLPQSDKLKISLVADDTAMPDHPNKHRLAQTYYNGHRIYAGCAHLVNSDYIAFLDEDDWYKPYHIESLVHEVEVQDLHFAYALADYYTQDKEHVAPDNHYSLGKWPLLRENPQTEAESYSITTSAYFFRRSFLVNVAHLWHYGYAADFRFSNTLLRNADIKCDTNGKHSLCYRMNSVYLPDRVENFLRSNAISEQRHPHGFPWLKP